jgi:3-oxoacyl-[acyl-carrier-protein] synthase-3
VKKSIISSLETYLPEKVLSNYDLEKTIDTTHEWIFTRTGIEQRHIVEKGEYTHDIAAKAALKTIEKEGISPLDIDVIIVATATPEKRCPSSAVRVQSIIGARNAFAFDIQAACSGFIYAISIADSFIKSETAQNILLIGAETLSLFTDWTDRSTCVLLGDGAGACIVKEGRSEDKSGIIDVKLFSDGDKHDLITITNSEKNENRGYMTMQGRAVFKHAIEYMYDSMISILKKNNMTFDDIDWIIPHQANRRVLESMSKMKEVPLEKIILTIDKHANTSSASIPLAMKFSIDQGIIKKNNTLLLTAIGAGLTWGAAIVKI